MGSTVGTIVTFVNQTFYFFHSFITETNFKILALIFTNVQVMIPTNNPADEATGRAN